MDLCPEKRQFFESDSCRSKVWECCEGFNSSFLLLSKFSFSFFVSLEIWCVGPTLSYLDFGFVQSFLICRLHFSCDPDKRCETFSSEEAGVLAWTPTDDSFVTIPDLEALLIRIACVLGCFALNFINDSHRRYL